MRASLFVLVAGLCGAVFATSATAVPDCAHEAAALVKDETDLPRLDAVSPKDRPPYCITLETIIAFSRRLTTHVAHCPGSAYASAAADWGKTRTDYSRLFAQHRCKRAIPK